MLINYCVGGVMNENMEMVRFCRGFLRGVSDLPIRPSEFAVLEILCAVPGAHTPASLAEKLGVSKPMLSAHLSSLIRRGVVLRVPSPEDGRSTYVVPTKMGKELFKKYSVNSEKMNVLKSALGQKNFDRFVQLIVRANQILGN
jgi:DNA-binding MarR family transcriptional regulator